MDPVTVSVTIDRPREEVFEYLADIANHPEFSDHYLEKWRLTREDSFGQGAGARYRLKRSFNRYAWEDITLVEVRRPHRIVGVGRGGKFNRVKTYSSWILSPGSGGGTKVDYTTETVPAMFTDRMSEAWGFRGWVKRQSRKALKRLRLILEDGDERGTRATVAGL
ncbi:MAG: SRPBCC family protein [Solirubrobacterales bacterium]|nr:SRPBCC family protein [Solirubrobacterales bacterium]